MCAMIVSILCMLTSFGSFDLIKSAHTQSMSVDGASAMASPFEFGACASTIASSSSPLLSSPHSPIHTPPHAHLSRAPPPRDLVHFEHNRTHTLHAYVESSAPRFVASSHDVVHRLTGAESIEGSTTGSTISSSSSQYNTHTHRHTSVVMTRHEC
jgi:hypothetical protein